MSDTTTGNASDSGYWGWLSAAKSSALELASKAQELAETASKVAQEKAIEIANKAKELKQNYDMEASTMFVPAGTRTAATGEYKLTKEDLRQLDMTYITENVIAMAFPRDYSLPGSQEECNDINVVAAYLKKKHNGRYMIWNISEEGYDYSKFADQVLEYKFPGHPAPPLGLLFKICTSVESWLDADEKNIAVVHCLTGKGRTATLIACILTWLGEFDSPMQALQYVAQRRGSTVEFLTIPSQRRYIQYFSNMLDGIRPNSEPLLLRRIILNSIPKFSTLPDSPDTDGCCPYVQLFKNGKLIATAAPYLENHVNSPGGSGDNKLQLRWVASSEGSASFRVDCPVQGDILLRCRHASASGTRVSMFRAAFHTGYISGGVLRLTKAQLDGSASDPRYPDDFFVDLIFAPISKSNDADLLGGEAPQASTDNGIVIDASLTDKYEQGLHKDARFWESITARKNRTKKRKQRKFEANEQDQFRIADDSKFLEDAEEAAEVSFLSSFTNVSTAHNADEDLIKQLAQMENEESTTELPPSDIVSTPVSKSGVVAELQALEDLEKELGLADLQLFSNEKVRQAIVSAPTPKPSFSVATSASTGGSDDLDELEKYLQSLSGNPS